ncbi:hypothetical protein MMC19_007029 [Ptychographa xylographoides]|nr:hypothetical protein [Ptychographa xylographoides]
MRPFPTSSDAFVTIFFAAIVLSFVQARLLSELHRRHHEQLHHARSISQAGSGSHNGSRFVVDNNGLALVNNPTDSHPKTVKSNFRSSTLTSPPSQNTTLTGTTHDFQDSKLELKLRIFDEPNLSLKERNSESMLKSDILSFRGAKLEGLIQRQSGPPCPGTNGTTFPSAAGIEYLTICNINIPGQDLPFESVATFQDCIAQCDSINSKAGEDNCLAVVFVPGRRNDANDCYLKYAINDATPTTATLYGAILISSATTAQSSESPAAASSTSTSTGYGASTVYAPGSSVIVPSIAYSQLHGPTQNQPSTQYFDVTLPADLTLIQSLLTVGIETDLSIEYPISPDTGVLPFNSTTEPLLADLTDTPHLSRDGGKGGLLNGQHMFIFCDTGSYSTTTDNSNGNFLAFVSSSVATDTGMNALYGNPIYLEDNIGEWSDNVGRMRGFSPLTAGEQGYNLVMQGQGQRYAIWPESSIIPINSQMAALLAPIVYDNVDETTSVATFTYTGATLLTLTAGTQAGPIADRAVDRIFEENEVEWGCIGGIRSWGPSGIGGNDGTVYLMGNVRGGLLLAKTSPNSVADRSSYQYWTGTSWSYGMQPPTSTAYFISGSFMDVDVFYSPRHLTFIIVYMTIYADSTFYYRYLLADQGILPPFAPGGDQSSDYVANILQYAWSNEFTLYKTGTGLSGHYTYAGGVHQGYFGADDIINGGTKMLLSWTAPTGQNPASEVSEYQIITAEIDWN